MSSTTTLSSSPTKLKRSYSIMLSSKDPHQDEAKPPKTSTPTPQQIFSWTLTPEAIALCHVRDVLSLQERLDGLGQSAQTNKHAGCDFYWLGRVPCRNVRVVGLVVEVTQYEYRTLYTVDDGTGVLECVQRTPAVQHIPEPGKPPPIAPEYPPPAAHVGDCVCVVGRARKKGEFWQLAIDSIDRSPSRNEELKHYMAVRRLHETHYGLREPFAVPIPEKVVQAEPSTPTRKPAAVKLPSTHRNTARPSTPPGKQSMAEPSTSHVAPSSPPTVFASSPVKEQEVPATPTKLRHPSRLHHAELTQNTFRIYLKYFMDNGPTHDDNNDPFSASHTTPTKASTSTPRPTGFSKWTSRLSIDPIDFNASLSRNENTMRGYSVSYLRRIPELALLAHRVAKQEIRTARKQAKEKAKSSSSTSAAVRQSSTPTKRDVKRLFVRAVNTLYNEGSIVIWDCPSHSCADLPVGDSSFLWKTSSSLPAPSANTTTGEEDLSGNLSDPDPNEDVFVPITPEFLAIRLEELIPVVQKAERMRAGRNVDPYSGASTEGLLRYLKKDDRWNHLHMDSVEAALKYLDDHRRAWMSGQGQWQLTV